MRLIPCLVLLGCWCFFFAALARPCVTASMFLCSGECLMSVAASHSFSAASPPTFSGWACRNAACALLLKGIEGLLRVPDLCVGDPISGNYFGIALTAEAWLNDVAV